jgi:hypothetical protein
MWKFSNGVSLKDGAQGATPAGSQDGTCVMQAIERNDPMGAPSRHYDQAEISPIELEGKEAFEVKLVETVEDELLARTASNHKIDDRMQSEDRMQQTVPAPAEIFCDKQHHNANTQTDELMDVEPRGKSVNKKKTKKQSLELLRDFRNSVVSNRDYTILNARSIILFVILFFTGLTCL